MTSWLSRDFKTLILQGALNLFCRRWSLRVVFGWEINPFSDWENAVFEFLRRSVDGALYPPLMCKTASDLTDLFIKIHWLYLL